jgi:hypothetical protein
LDLNLRPRGWKGSFTALKQREEKREKELGLLTREEEGSRSTTGRWSTAGELDAGEVQRRSQGGR